MTERGSTGPRLVAEEVFAEHGVDFGGATRGRGWTNATWLADELVIRVAREPEQRDLLREQRLAALLPAEVGYPETVAAGTRHGHEWVLTRRVAGENLEEAWPSLDDATRSRAVVGMWERARHVHRVDVAAAAPHARARSPFFPADAAGAMAAVDRLVTAGELTEKAGKGLGRALDAFWAALPDAPRAVNHGDLCAPNTLWRDGEVVALLDFEFAVIAPIAIDLNEIVKVAFGPGRHDERAGVRDVVTGIARSALPEAGGPDVLVGYSIMLEMWLLAEELAAGDDIDEDGHATSSGMLKAFAEGDGGYFAPLLADLR